MLSPLTTCQCKQGVRRGTRWKHANGMRRGNSRPIGSSCAKNSATKHRLHRPAQCLAILLRSTLLCSLLAESSQEVVTTPMCNATRMVHKSSYRSIAGANLPPCCQSASRFPWIIPLPTGPIISKTLQATLACFGVLWRQVRSSDDVME